MRHALMSHHRLLTYTLVALLVMLLFGAALPMPERAAAQSSEPLIASYGRSITGTVTTPGGAEYLFTGCAGETVSLNVETDGFAPRLQLFAPQEEDEALVNVAATANASSVSIDDFALTTSGPYLVVVSGRSRADRGDFALTLNGTGPDNPIPDDNGMTLNLLYGESVEGSIESENVEQWHFRGCAGDEILAMLETGDFVPQVDLRFPIAELAIESAGVEVIGNDATATLRRTLPANGPYTLIVSGASDEDAGDYTLDLTLEGRSAEIPATSTPEVEASPTARATATRTATAEETATSTGPRGRRGLPTPRATADATRTQPAVTPRATATPRPTSGATPSPTATSAVTSVPTPTRTASATPTPFLPTQLEIFCTVITDRLNLRPGPGTNFTPIIDVLEIGELLVVVGRNDDSSWLQVEVLDENLIIENTGWVSAEFVFCVGDINDAPVIEGDA